MKKIVPYKKELEFKTEVAEIASISLEHTLQKVGDNYISGNFMLNGEYKIVDISVNTEKFDFELPFEISIDKKYDTSNLTIDIDDFYYELKGDKMAVNIDVLLDNLEEKEEVRTVIEPEVKKEVKAEEKKEVPLETKDEVRENFLNSLNVTEAYRTYKVYIIREGDTLNSILERFQVTKEDLEAYNDISNITVGLKIIIPTTIDEKV
ncbi:MAG: LysM peptidoglycan-binding domain-containing protein [Erysipelotrichaceae bacterium]|nr:LysM peptidoglycan-binding domain-containing protein [Erysipelotrichaceae bacterium]